MRTVVLGATGYVGGRLVPVLLSAGHEVVCTARDPQRLTSVDWRSDVEVVRADLQQPDSLGPAVSRADVVYYLVHSIGSGDDFAEEDRRAARNLAEAAARSNVSRVVYLGGLGPDEHDRLSPHLASRHEVGAILASGPVPVTELRAAIIIGSGSASFEMLRSLVELLPVMVVPRWVSRTRCQPIAIGDVLAYLAEVIDHPETAGKVLDIGGPEIVTYVQMMQAYAAVAGLRRRLIIPVPVLSPRLSSHWLNLVTPLPIGLARPLVDSLTTDVVVREDHDIGRFVSREAISVREAIERALRRRRNLDIPTSWSSSTASVPARHPTGRENPAESGVLDPNWSGETVLCDVREVETTAEAAALYAVVSGVGGERGWYGFDRLWRLRGAVDKVLGGVGVRRGRRHPDDLRVGDTLDFWRAEVVQPAERLLLHAEMRLPGQGWLEWRIEERVHGRRVLRQRASFVPRGLWGRVYWLALSPVHGLVFGRLCKRLVAAAERRSA